jgi:hypothetical protein
MKAICGLIPAALLAGTVLSNPAYARGTTGFGEAISKQDYFIVMSARKLGKPKKVGSLKAAKQVASPRKATKKVLKSVDLKPRKKPAKLAVAERKPVAAPKPDEIKPREIARLEPLSMSKVLRSGPREEKKVGPGEALQASGASEVQTTPSEPVSMSKVLRSGPRDVKDNVLGEALQDNGASEVQIARSEPVSMSKVRRSGPRVWGETLQDNGASEVQTARLGPVSMSLVLRSGPRVLAETLQDNGASEVQTARLEPLSMSLVLRSGPRDVKDTVLGEALQDSGASEVETARLEPLSMSQVLRSGPREVNIDASEVRIIEVISETAPYYGVPTWFALRIAEVESGYNPYARGRAGEIGLYQLKCPTARGMGFKGDCSNLTNARTNVRWGLKHLSLAIALSGGNLKLAASKHNAGLGRKSLVSGYVAKVF